MRPWTKTISATNLASGFASSGSYNVVKPVLATSSGVGMVAISDAAVNILGEISTLWKGCEWSCCYCQRRIQKLMLAGGGKDKMGSREGVSAIIGRQQCFDLMARANKTALRHALKALDYMLFAAPPIHGCLHGFLCPALRSVLGLRHAAKQHTWAICICRLERKEVHEVRSANLR